MNSRRSLLSTTALLAPALAVAACTGTAATNFDAQVAKIVSYTQAGLTTITTGLTMFGGQLSAAAQQEAETALRVAQAASTAVGSAVSQGALAVANATTTTNLGSLIGAAATALLAGLTIIPNPASPIAALILALRGVQALAPSIAALAGSIISPATVSASAPTMGADVAAKRLGLML